MGYFIARDPRGCDVVCMPTWESHADQRERLCGAEMAQTRGSATRVHADARMVPRGSV